MLKCLFNILILLAFSVTLSHGDKPAAKSSGEVLSPIEGYHSYSGAVWLVVRGTKPPEVTIDGAKVIPIGKPDLEGLGHYRLEGIKPEGSTITVSVNGRRTTLKVLGSMGEAGKTFHRESFGPCSECHSYTPKDCRKCHSFCGSDHAEKLKCLECHPTPGEVPASVAGKCKECHNERVGSIHKKLKHPLSANADPKRPGRQFECVSCHNPHMPKCFHRMDQEEMRQWCKSCHSR